MNNSASYKMKETNYPWIKKIPSHWQIVRMKSILQNVSKKGHPDAEVLSLYRDLGVIPKNSRDDNHNATSDDTASYKYVESGNLVINKMKAWQGSLGVSEYEGIVSPAYYVCRFRDDTLIKRYFHYLVRCKAYAQEFERLSTGMRIGQWDLGIDDFMNTPAIIPPLEEQATIARFLDDQCAQIDSLIEETKASIEEYKKLKASVIEETVTKGINPAVETRETNLEWITNIPISWKIKRLKYLFSFAKGLPITKEDLTEEGIPVISYGQIHAKFNTGTGISDALFRFVPESYVASNPESLVHAGDMLVADTSEDYEGCGNCAYIDREMPLFAGYHTIILRSEQSRDNKFLAYLFKSDAWRMQIRTRASGVKVFSISKKILNASTVVLPPQNEQEEIVAYLDEQCESIDSMIESKQSLIADLEAYKRSLIFETVTGKRKVV